MIFFHELTPKQPLSGKIVGPSEAPIGEIPSRNSSIIHRTLFITSPDFEFAAPKLMR